MMKKFRKMIALLTAMVMVLSMYTSVFAATDEETVTVLVKTDDGGEVFKETVSLSALEAKMKNYTSGHLYEVPSGVTYSITAATAADALIYAYNQYMEDWTDAYYDSAYESTYVATEKELSYAWDQSPSYGDPGLYFLYYYGKTSETLEYTSNYYKGTAWELYINSVSSSVYASSVVLSAGDEITFYYHTQEYSW